MLSAGALKIGCAELPSALAGDLCDVLSGLMSEDDRSGESFDPGSPVPGSRV